MIRHAIVLIAFIVFESTVTFVDGSIADVDLVEWMLRHEGAYFSEKVQFRPLDTATATGGGGGKGRSGLFATENIRKGEHIMVLPPSMLFFQEQEGGGNAAATAERERKKMICGTAEKLVREYRLGEQSEFHPYVQHLFEPYNFNNSGSGDGKGREVHAKPVVGWSRPSKDLLRSIVDADLFPLTGIDSTYHAVCHHRQIKSSLKKQRTLSGSAAAAIADYNNNNDEKQLYDLAFRTVVARGWDEVLIPVFDMVNHRNGYYHNIDLERDENTTDAGEAPDTAEAQPFNRTLTIVAIRDIQKGEQCYYSFNGCNTENDKDCQKIEWTYFSSDTLVDFGIVEPYPQIWKFETIGGTIVYQVNQTMTRTASTSKGITDGISTVQWLNMERPTLEQVNWLRGQQKRLESMKQSIYQSVETLEAQHEGKVILQLYETLRTALEQAILWAKPDQMQPENKIDGVLETGGQHQPACVLSYDPLAPQPDPLDYNVFICSPITGDQDEKQLTHEKTQSQYQKISFSNYGSRQQRNAFGPSASDTCLSLDDWIHTCTSFRPHYHEAFVHYPAKFLPKVRRVLYIGGGDNMILHELFKYNATLELVVGMELDQQVARSSFQHMATQPHFDQAVVQWWFGDAAKSLQVLPEEYYGTFDLVLIDLLTFVADNLKVTKGWSLMDFAVHMLLRPDGGIISRNDDFVKRQNVDFARETVELEYHDLPVLCQQSISMGSNSIEFLKTATYDHDVETLVLHQRDHYGAWYNFRRHDRKELDSYSRTCREGEGERAVEGAGAGTVPDQSTEKERQEKDAPAAETPGSQGNRYGVLLVLEAENITSLASAPNLREALHKIGLGEISYFESTPSENNQKKEKNSGKRMVFVLQEGYLVARNWLEQSRYCAFDLLLWSSFDKLEAARTELLASVGSTAQTSFRITTGGMHGSGSSPKFPDYTSSIQGQKQEREQPCTVKAAELEQSTVGMIFRKLSTAFIQKKQGVVVVVCGDKSSPCQLLEAMKQHDDGGGDVNTVIPLWACPALAASWSISACKDETLAGLKDIVSVGKGKISRLVIDFEAPHGMGQVLHKIFNYTLVRRELLEDSYVVLAATTLDKNGTAASSSSSSWGEVLLDRFRTEFEQFSPAHRADLFFRTIVADSGTDDHKNKTESLGMGVFSFGDTSFYSHLAATISTLENWHSGLTAEVRRVEDAMVNYVAGFRPSRVVTNAEYSKDAAEEQWLQQRPVAVQEVLQFELRPTTAPVWPGEHVLINLEKDMWTGEWYDGFVVTIKDDETYDVVYKDGTEGNEERSAIRKLDEESLEGPIEVGTRVLVDQEGVWYQGTVLDMNKEDGTFKLQLFNFVGSVLESVAREFIIPQAEPPIANAHVPFSAVRLKQVILDALQYSIKGTAKEEDPTMALTAFARDVGEGFVVVAFWPGGNTVVSWDGRSHLDMNLFSPELASKSQQQRQDLVNFVLKGVPSLSKILHDVHPRGYGRVVNFQRDLRRRPIWVQKKQQQRVVIPAAVSPLIPRG